MHDAIEAVDDLRKKLLKKFDPEPEPSLGEMTPNTQVISADFTIRSPAKGRKVSLSLICGDDLADVQSNEASRKRIPLYKASLKLLEPLVAEMASENINVLDDLTPATVITEQRRTLGKLMSLPLSDATSATEERSIAGRTERQDNSGEQSHLHLRDPSSMHKVTVTSRMATGAQDRHV
jgi:hypothetical protein